MIRNEYPQQQCIHRVAGSFYYINNNKTGTDWRQPEPLNNIGNTKSQLNYGNI